METGEKLIAELEDELMVIGLPNMAAKLDALYSSEQFTRMDHLSLIAELIGPEYQDKVTKRVNNRLRNAKLIGAPEDLEECRDSKTREYLPAGITTQLASMRFVRDGLNVCILGPSGSGKTYLAKALGVVACNDFKVEYHHCDEFFAQLAELRERDFVKFEKRLRILTKLDLLIIDDFLLNAINDECEIKLLVTVLEKRIEACRSTVVCSQREPKSWKTMMRNDEVVSDAVMKRATKHFTVVINPKAAS